MAFLDDDACPFDWAEYNLPAELLTQAGAVLPAFAAPMAVPGAYEMPSLHAAMPPDDLSSNAL